MKKPIVWLTGKIEIKVSAPDGSKTEIFQIQGSNPDHAYATSGKWEEAQRYFYTSSRGLESDYFLSLSECLKDALYSAKCSLKEIDLNQR